MNLTNVLEYVGCSFLAISIRERRLEALTWHVAADFGGHENLLKMDVAI